jgi:hypothetical protein
MTDLTSDHTSNDLLHALILDYRESGDRYVMTYLNLRSYLKCHHLRNVFALSKKTTTPRTSMISILFRKKKPTAK